MPRNVTLTFSDGSSHVYNNVPDDAKPDAVTARAAQEFAGKQITNIDGGKSAAPPEPGFSGAAGKAVEPMNKAPATAFGVPTFDPHSAQNRAQPILETLTGPGKTATAGQRFEGALGGGAAQQPEWLQKQRQIETELRAAGKSDTEISADPRWQEASRNLSRSVSAGAGQTALGETVGAPVASMLGKGVAAAAKPVVGMVKDAVGRESAAALQGVSGEAKAGVTNLISGAQKDVATGRAVNEATAGRPGAKVLEVSKPQTVDPALVTQARAATQAANRELMEAQTKLQAAQRNMSGMDKYAGNRRSEPMVRAARRDLNKAQADVNRLTVSRDEMTAAQKELETAHRESLQAAKRGERQEVTSAKQVERDAARAEDKITNLTMLRAKLDAAKEPADVSRLARQIGDQLFKAGKMSERQYNNYLSRVSEMVDKSKSTEEARKKMVLLMKGAALAGAVGGAGAAGYEIRRFF